MKTEVNVILIGNYPLDRQESMERFARMLQQGFRDQGLKAEIWQPTAVLGKLARTTNAGWGKWLGYMDKWVLFPLQLKIRLRKNKFRHQSIRFHVCDHSNAPYLKFLPASRTGITCHDVLAIRGALGFADAYCPASRFGVLLQKWILKHLVQAQQLAAVSGFTLTQLQELAGPKTSLQKEWRVIHNGYNAHFKQQEPGKVKSLLATTGLKPNVPFILHVGSALERKNRRMILDMVATLGDRWKGLICYAGKEVDAALKAHARLLGVDHRVVSVVKPSHDLLLALYNACDAFVFPSFSEGFGWPVIEAQACGAPVIASSYQPMPEVSGGAAMHADPTDPSAFARALLSLQNRLVKTDLLQRGFANASRFTSEHMIREYLSLHGFVPVQHKEPCLSN